MHRIHRLAITGRRRSREIWWRARHDVEILESQPPTRAQPLVGMPALTPSFFLWQRAPRGPAAADEDVVFTDALGLELV